MAQRRKHRVLMPTKGKKSADHPSFGFADWNLETYNKFQEYIKAVLVEGLDLATKEYDCFASFVVSYNDPDVEKVLAKDPTMIRVYLPVGATEDEEPSWFFSIADLVDEFIDFAMLEYEDYQPRAVAIRDMLSSLSDQIDSKLPPKLRRTKDK